MPELKRAVKPELGEYFLARARAAVRDAPPLTAEEVEAQSRAELRALREERIEIMRGVITPEDFEAVAADNLNEGGEGSAIKAVRGWYELRHCARTPWSMLVLLGDPGRGKTVAAAWLLAQLGGLYVTAEELRRLFSGYGRAAEEEVARILRARLLIVDDVGTEREAETAQSALFEVVNKRQGLVRAWTLITGNMEEAAFAARYGERTVRRIHHQGAFAEVVGEDLRRPG